MAPGLETAAPSPAVRRPPTFRSGLRSHGREGSAGPVVQLDTQLRERPSAFGSEIEHRLVARAHRIPRGPFDPRAIAPDTADAFGLLILDGLIAVDLNAGRARVSWLIGPDDFIRPWEMSEISLIERPRWHALADARVAVLDGSFVRRALGIPTVARALVARAAQTSHWLLAKSLIVSAPVVEERLLLLFALLAERWGKVRPDGVWLELPLTHDLLARMSGARRPSVSTALRALHSEGLIESVRRGCWVLHGRPPSQSAAGWMANPSWRAYAEAIGFADTAECPDAATPRSWAA